MQGMGRGAPDAGLAHSHRQPAGRRQGQRQGRAAQPGRRVNVKQDEDRVAPRGGQQHPRDCRHKAPGAAGAAGERSRGRGELGEEASFSCFPDVVKFIPVRGPLPFPSPQPEILPQAGSPGSCPPFRSPPKWTSARRHLAPPGPLEHAPSAVPAWDLPSHLLSPVHRAPHHPDPQQSGPEGPRDLFLWYRVQTEGRGRCWVRRGGHSTAAVRGS